MKKFLSKKHWFRILISVFVILLFSNAEGGNPYYFEQISIDKGLSQSAVTDVLRDERGLLWIGTKYGLNRYDGTYMRNYFYDDDSRKGSLPGNYIFFVEEDYIGNIWVGTDQGLAKYIPYSDSFESVTTSENYKNAVYSNFMQMGNTLYFGSSDHVALYNTQVKDFSIIPFKTDDHYASIPLNYSMVKWKNSSVLLANRWRGLFVLDINSGELSKSDFLSEDLITDIHVDQFRRIWTGIYNEGIKVFNWNGEEIASYNSKNSVLSNDIILTIDEVDNFIWAGTDGGGINIIDVETEEFSFIKNVPEDRTSIPVNSITHIYIDNYSAVWAGTLRGGVFGIRQVGMSSYTHAPLYASFGLSNPTVLSLYEDDDGLWIGTDGGGVNLFNYENRDFTHFGDSYDLKVNAITKLDEGHLLINCYGKGLKIFDKKSGFISSLSLFDYSDYIPGQQHIGVSLRYNSGSIYIFEDKIYRYDPEQRIISKIADSNLRDTEGELMVAGEYGGSYILYGALGIYEFDYKNEAVNFLIDIESEVFGDLLSATVDKDGLIWIGTSKGLYTFDSVNKSVDRVESGLFRSVNSLIAGDDNRIWFGSAGKLLCYYKELKSFRIYGSSDGVMSNEYLPKAVLRTSTGELFKGGVTGLLHIEDDKTYDIGDYTSTPQIIELREDGTLIDSDKFNIFKSTGEVELPFDYNSFSVRLFVTDENFFNTKYIRYKVEGVNRDYIETATMDIDMPNLSHGVYHLKVQVQSSHGGWSEPFSLLQIRVLPPWWFSWWFLTISVLFILMLLFLFRYFAYRRAHDKMQIEMANHDNVVKEQKIKFLINISHELRTPLSLISGPLERILRGKYGAITQAQLSVFELMNRNLSYIKNLIDQILDIRAFEKEESSINPVKTDFNLWLKQIITDFKSEFDARGVTISFYPGDSVEVDIDRDKCKKVFYNILNNALKFSPNGSEVIVSTRVLEINRIIISVIDQGPGIPEGMLEKIFDRFYTGDILSGGAGIGLAYSKMLIELHKGTVKALNKSSGGAEFRIELPLTQSIKGGESVNIYDRNDIDDYDYKLSSSLSYDENVFKEYNILVVEDDLALLKFMKESLSEYFKKVYTASDGNRALDIIRENNPDIVVSDVMMPIMDGWELCRKLKSDIKISHIPLILLTARSSEADSVKGYKMGADNYLVKPVSIDLLLSIIYNTISFRKQIKEHYAGSIDESVSKKITFSNADEQFLTRVNAFIEEHIGNPDLSVDYIASNMAMSRATLYSKFKSLLDTGVNSYINRYRISYALNLLKETDMPVSEISHQLGFTSQSYFSTMFKQQQGVTPVKYRQINS
ncbi:response regulator [Marinilabiliaceae bacterium ANBcel2]|nr:response regulator [Marinilabiliaceae bacterium ANBcel2]